MNKNKYKVVKVGNQFAHELCTTFIWDLFVITEAGDYKLATIHSETEPTETEWETKLIATAEQLKYHSKEIVK